jgi:serine/threonine-protein kinase
MNLEFIGSRYRILRELGRGGMGVVYLVEHLHTGERLALKVLQGAAATDAGAIARFKREARVGAQLKSDHVVRITDADVAPELGGAPFFVMELLEGLDLEQLVERVGALAPDVVIAVLSQIAGPLDKAHASGIVHRDLKPENVFLHRREDGTLIAKILDFGISKFLSPDPSSSATLGKTADGTLMGTPHYMAPEQARGLVQSIGPATDMWAMGLIAQRLLTGGIYWTAQTQADLLIEILAAPMPAPSLRWPFVGQRFDAWFARSCHRDPSQRWRTISEQVAALAEALRDVPEFDAQPASRGATIGTVNHALQERIGTEAKGGPMPAFGLPTPGSKTSMTPRPFRSEPTSAAFPSPWTPGGGPPSPWTSGGSGTMAIAENTHAAETGAFKPKSRKVALTVGVIGSVAGVAIVLAFLRPDSAPVSVNAAGPVMSVERPTEPNANQMKAQQPAFAEPMVVPSDSGPSREELRDEFDTSEPRLAPRSTAHSPWPSPRATTPVRGPSPRAAPKLHATTPPQDDPLAP